MPANHVSAALAQAQHAHESLKLHFSIATCTFSAAVQSILLRMNGADLELGSPASHAGLPALVDQDLG